MIIVYEWEDELLTHFLGGSLVTYNFPNHRACRIIRNRIHFINKIMQTGKPALYFEMFANDNYDRSYNHGINKKNIIPWIIDCYTKDDDHYKYFCQNYNRNSLVLLSSKEVYDYFKSKGCKLPIMHLALSLSDKYRITPETKYEIPFDIVLLGRQNPLLGQFLERYRESHPNLKIAYRKHVDGQWLFYNQDGNYIGDANTRENFIKITRLGKVGLYSTPGIDSEKNTNGFSQVTPRFLEYVAAGSHIIARYSNNSDAQYYELDKFSPNVESYEQFEQQMDYALTHDVDMTFYSEYLKKHYTSVRAEELKSILSNK